MVYFLSVTGATKPSGYFYAGQSNNRSGDAVTLYMHTLCSGRRRFGFGDGL